LLRTLKEIIDRARRRGKKRLAVAAANETEVLRAVDEARQMGLIDGVFLGRGQEILASCKVARIDPNNFAIIDIETPALAAKECCRMVRHGEADFMMKGSIRTGDFMKAILDKQEGLNCDSLLSHVAIFEIPGFDRLLFVTDAAINIAPILSEKIQIIQNAVNLACNLGYDCPKVACLAAVEVINPEKMPDTGESAALSIMSLRGQIRNCIIDGPLALDVAINRKAAQTKGLKSPVAGYADLLMAPEIVSANVLYKSLTCLANAKAAAIVTGAIAPVVLTSRADDHETKLLSIAMGVAGI